MHYTNVLYYRSRDETYLKNAQKPGPYNLLSKNDLQKHANLLHICLKLKRNKVNVLNV